LSKKMIQRGKRGETTGIREERRLTGHYVLQKGGKIIVRAKHLLVLEGSGEGGRDIGGGESLGE